MKSVDLAFALNRRLAFLEVRIEREQNDMKGTWCELEASAIQEALERLGLFDAARLERMMQGVRDRVMPVLEQRGKVVPLRRVAT